MEHKEAPSQLKSLLQQFALLRWEPRHAAWPSFSFCSTSLSLQHSQTNVLVDVWAGENASEKEIQLAIGQETKETKEGTWVMLMFFFRTVYRVSVHSPGNERQIRWGSDVIMNILSSLLMCRSRSVCSYSWTPQKSTIGIRLSWWPAFCCLCFYCLLASSKSLLATEN